VEQKPYAGSGLVFGLGIVVALTLLSIGLVVLAITEPISLLTIVRVLLVLANVLVTGMVLYGLTCLSSARYALDRNAVTIRWGGSGEVIPLTNVQAVSRAREQGPITHFRGLRWPGYHVGRGKIAGMGNVQVYCTAPAERQLVITTSSGSFAISPENPDRFLDQFAAQRELGPSQSVEQISVRVSVAARDLVRDRVGLALLAVGGLLNLALFSLVVVRHDQLPRAVPLRYSGGLPERYGSPADLLALAAVGLVAWIVDGLLGGIIYFRVRDRIAAHLLWGAAVGLQLLLLTAVANVRP
jgi:hypothetical protein